MRPVRPRPPREAGAGHRLCVAILAALAPLTGCFDGAAVVQAHRKDTNLVRLDEIDLGEFRVTLPRTLGGAGGGAVEFHAFGEAAVRDRGKVAEAFASGAPEMRHRIVMLIRGLSPAEIEEPTLQSLRDKLAVAANASLDKPMVTSVGFYRFAFTPDETRSTSESSPTAEELAKSLDALLGNRQDESERAGQLGTR